MARPYKKAIRDDFDPLIRAGVTKTQFARVFNVTRVTADSIMTGRTTPGTGIRTAIKQFVEAVERGIAARELPINPSGMTASQAEQVFIGVVRKHGYERTIPLDMDAELSR